MKNQQAGAELKQIECTESFYIGFFVAFFYIDNRVFRKTNSSGKPLDTRQKIFYAALSVTCPFLWGAFHLDIEYSVAMKYTLPIFPQLKGKK